MYCGRGGTDNKKAGLAPLDAREERLEIRRVQRVGLVEGHLEQRLPAGVLARGTDQGRAEVLSVQRVLYGEGDADGARELAGLLLLADPAQERVRELLGRRQQAEEIAVPALVEPSRRTGRIDVADSEALGGSALWLDEGARKAAEQELDRVLRDELFEEL